MVRSFTCGPLRTVGRVGLVTALAVSCAPSGDVRLPDGFEAFRSLISVSGDYVAGCIRSVAGDMYMTWEAQVQPVRSIEEDVPGGLVWTKTEQLGTDELSYGLTRSGALIARVRTFTLVATVRNQPDIDRVLDVARARTAPRYCRDCQRRPILTAPPYRRYSDIMNEGCSLPIDVPPSEGISAPPVQPMELTIGQLDKAFQVADRAKQWFAARPGWLLQPSCTDGRLSRITVDWDLRRRSEWAAPDPLDPGAFVDLLRRIDSVVSLGVDHFGFSYGPFEPVRVGWPIHAQFRHAMLEGDVYGGAPLQVKPFNIWFYRPISGVIEEIRGPIGSDRRAVLKIRGEWYWTNETVFSALRKGQHVENVMAAGPDGPPTLSDRGTCVPISR